jgi:hypothetical protein
MGFKGGREQFQASLIDDQMTRSLIFIRPQNGVGSTQPVNQIHPPPLAGFSPFDCGIQIFLCEASFFLTVYIGRQPSKISHQLSDTGVRASQNNFSERDGTALEAHRRSL